MSQQFSTYYSSAYRTDTYFFDKHSATNSQAVDPGRCVPYDLIAFLSLIIKNKIDIYQVTWDGSSSALGVGGTAIVNQGAPGEEGGIAFKRINMMSDDAQADAACNDLSADTRVFKALMSEVSILTHPAISAHPNIIDLEAICFETNFNFQVPKILPVLMFEKAPCGDLEDFIEQNMELEYGTILRLLKDVLQTVECLHSNHLIHGDIKPKNILVFTDSDGKPFPKLADFGFSLQETDIAIKLPVSKGWNAPEVTYAYPDMSFQQAQKADIYSCGLLALWLLAHVIRCGTHLASHPNGHSATPTRPLVGRDLQPAWYEIAADVHLHGPAASGVTKSLDEIANVTTPTCIKAMSAYFDSSLAVNPEERAQNCLQLLGVLQLPMPEPLHLKPEASATIHSLAPSLCGTFEVAPLMGQIADLDFRIRDRVVQLLRRLANDQRACPACSRNAALQLATCVKIGFGVMADEADCQRLLAYSGKSNTDLESIISSLQGSGGGDIQSLRMLSLVMSGYFLLDEVSGNTQYIGDLATPLHTLEQELDSVLACLGPNHLVTWSLFSSLSARYERIEDYKHGEVLCRKAIAQYDQQIIISTGEDQEISKTRRALMLRNLAKILLDTSKLPEALQVAEDGIAEYEAINKGAVLDMQDAKRILARVHAGLGSYEKAIMIVEQLLESQLQTLDQQHWSVKSTREVLAEVLMERSSYSEAERVLLQLLDGMTEMTTDIANLKHRLGNLYWFQDRFTDSLTQLEEVKRFWESYGRRLGIVAPEYAPLLLDMADTLFSLDRFEDALPFARKAVTVSENLSDQTHDRAFGTLVDIRCSLQDLSGLEEVAQSLCEARTQLYGSGHELTLSGQKRLANILLEQGQDERAETILHEIVHKYEGGDLVRTRPRKYYAVLWELAETLNKQRKWDEALPWFSKVVELSLQVHGKDHPQYWSDKESLAEARSKGEGWEERLSLRLHALQAAKQKFGCHSVQAIDMMAEVANAHFNLKQFEAGEAIYKEIVPMQTKIGGPRTAKTLRCKTNLAFSMGMVGIIRNDTQKREEALKMEEDVFSTAKELLGLDHEETQHVCENLMMSYNMLGRKKDVVRMQQFYHDPDIPNEEPSVANEDSEADWETDSEDDS